MNCFDAFVGFFHPAFNLRDGLRHMIVDRDSTQDTLFILYADKITADVILTVFDLFF